MTDITGNIQYSQELMDFLSASRLRDNRLDYECYVCNLEHSAYAKSKNPLFTNYFYRVVHIWNKLPLSTRRKTNLDNFKNFSKKFL